MTSPTTTTTRLLDHYDSFYEETRRLVPTGLDVQRCQSPYYWYVVCKHCRLTWYLPKDPTKRTKEAIGILAAHVATHERER